MSNETNTTDIHTIIDDIKTGVKLAKDNALSYVLAHIGMGFALVFILAIIAIPILAFAIFLGPVTWSGFATFFAGLDSTGLFVLGGTMGLILIPIVAILLTVNGAIFGMSKEVVETGKTKAETSFSFLWHKFLPMFLAGIFLTLIIVAPQALVWYIASYMGGWTIPLLTGQLLAVFSFVYSNITLGFCALVLPAVVNGVGVFDAFRESFKLAIDRFDRIFGLLIGFNVLFLALFGPMIALGLLAPLAWTNLVFLPAIAIVGLWTVIAGILTFLLFIPGAYISWMKVYHELTGRQIAAPEVPEVPML